MTGRGAAILAVAAIGLTGCINPQRYETVPVQVQTAQGLVTCQLYTRNTVAWDRAIDIPPGMNIATGDQVCRAEGERLIAEAGSS
ncbi:MAG: hypothetical protein AAGA28_09915 [Pseudomonadota bacterium]